MSGLILPGVDERNFREVVLLSNQPVVVFFHDPNVNNSTTMQHVIQSLLWLYDERLLFFQVNIQDNPVLGAHYNVKQAPACMLLLHGRDEGRITGRISGRHLMVTLDDFLARATEYAGCANTEATISADDVIDIHRFLASFDGDFAHLFHSTPEPIRGSSTSSSELEAA